MKLKTFISAIILILIVLTASVTISEVKNNKLFISFTDCSHNGEIPVSAVACYKRNNKRFFMLPGGADMTKARIWFTGTDSIRVNGVETANGSKIENLTENSILNIGWNNSEFDVNIMKGSEIGALFINTDSGSMDTVDKSKKNKESGYAFFLNPQGKTEYSGAMRHIKLRGNTSANMTKKNYNVCLETNADLMGMGKARNWVLMGSSRDRSQLRNQIVYETARFVGLPYTPECKPIDLYMNHEYHGTYLLCEKIEMHPERVNIRDLGKANEKVNPAPLNTYKRVFGQIGYTKYKAFRLEQDPVDITGGYIIEYENYQPRYSTELCAMQTRRKKVLLIKEPEYASVAEMEYICRFMQGYENAIFAKDGIDPDSGKHYTEFVDFNSLVLKYMLEEVSMNCDGNASSQYYVKPSDTESKVAFAGPVWDYDTTFGDYARAKGSEYRLLDPKQLVHGQAGSAYWWPQLYKKKEFFDAVREAWKFRYKPALQILLDNESDPEGKLLSIRQYAENLEKSAEMNFIRWPMYAFDKKSQNIARTGYTYEDNIQYLIRFITERVDFLDTIWQ